MQTTIPEVTAARADVARIAIGQLRVGPIDVGRLVVTNARFGVHAGQAQLRDVHLTMSLDFRLVWSIVIPLPWPFDDITIVERTTPLGTLAIPFPFGDATVPGLQDITLDIPQLVANDVTTAVDPLTGLQLTDVAAQGFRAFDIALPTAGFGLAGLGLTGVKVNQVDVPGVSVSGASVRQVDGAPVAVPAVRLRGLALPAASANDIASGPLDLTVDRDDPFSIPPGGSLNLGILRVGLRVFASARMEVARMQLSNVQASASAETIELQDVTVPYGAVEVTLSDLGISTIDVPLIGVD